MRFDLTFYPFVCVALILLALLFYRFRQGGKSSPAGLKLPRRKRESKPFVGLSRSLTVRCVSNKSGLNRTSPAHLHPVWR
jgi:hypothetical protein